MWYRYGNVCTSRGSVIPLFVERIKQNKAITITNPNMTRFLMSLDEAVGLVEYAFSYGQSGDIMIQKSSACTIIDLAKTLLELFHAENTIKIIGTRHGENYMAYDQEEFNVAEDKGDFYRIPADKRAYIMINTTWGTKTYLRRGI